MLQARTVGALLGLFLLTTFCLPLGAHAQDNAAAAGVSTLNLGSSADPTPDWIITLGAGGEYGPRYDGAKRMGFSFMPSDFSIRRPGEPDGFSAPDDGFDYTLVERGSFSFGPVADFRFGRSRSDDYHLVHLHNIASSVDAGIFAEYWIVPDRLRTRIEVRQALQGREGLVADLSADWVQNYGPFTASLGPRLSLANGTFMRSSFGVSDAEALANPYVNAFRASSGARSVGAVAALRYKLSPSWSGTVYDNYEYLVGDAGASPITARIGTRDQNTVGLSVSYSFGVKLH